MEADILKIIERFHGHLGPYVVIGYRMGMIANDRLGNDPFSKWAKAMTGTRPPVSCLIDGIQLSTGCTLGKGNMTAENGGIARAMFGRKGEGASLIITLRDDITERIGNAVTKDEIEELAREIAGLPDDILFDID